MRLFIATNFPEVVLRDLNDRAVKLKPRLPAASWVREEAQHVTLVFLGEQPEANRQPVGERTRFGGVQRRACSLMAKSGPKGPTGGTR